MNDKELLKLAAKAYLSKENFECKAYMDGFMGVWNPLTNDADALRLAVELGMVVDTNYNGGVVAGNAKIPLCDPEYGYQEGVGNKDLMAATRRAIVNVAAELGK